MKTRSTDRNLESSSQLPRLSQQEDALDTSKSTALVPARRGDRSGPMIPLPPRPPPPPVGRRASPQATLSVLQVSPQPVEVAGESAEFTAERLHGRDDHHAGDKNDIHYHDAATQTSDSDDRNDNRDDAEDDEDEKSRTVQHPQHFWILRVRKTISQSPSQNVQHKSGRSPFAVTTPPQSTTNALDDDDRSSIVNIQVSRNTTAQSLSRGLQHALLGGVGRCRSNDDSPASSSYTTSSVIPGLFVEGTGTYVLLEDLLQHVEIYGKPSVTLTTHLSLPQTTKPTAQTPSIFTGGWYWWSLGMLLILITWWIWQRHEVVESVGTMPTAVGHALWSGFNYAHHHAIVSPLEALYRNGPWILGCWEGESLPRVCARITFHGDADFWHRNVDDCQRIYYSKQRAWMRIALTLAYSVLSLLLVIGACRILTLWWRVRHPTVSPAQQEAAETYRAIQILVQQVKKNI